VFALVYDLQNDDLQRASNFRGHGECMRIFVSSSFEDLKEHRAAAIRVLRQLGHEIIAMEDMTAGSLAPLPKVLDMVDRSEVYVGIFAWRYGYSPQQGIEPAQPAPIVIPNVKGAKPGETSITHYEYLRAVERGLPVMSFLLDERCPWPPEFIDGFDRTRAGAQLNTDRIQALRLSLQQERVVSWFTTPADLEARVSAAITAAGLTRQLDLQAAAALPPGAGKPEVASDSVPGAGIAHAVINAQHALKIDLAETWWSTRLYLIACLAERLTQARRILIVDTSRAQTPLPGDPAEADERFIGQLSTGAVLSVVGTMSPQLQAFKAMLQTRPLTFNEIHIEIRDLINLWDTGFGANGEVSVKVDLTSEMLRRWFGEAMITSALEISDLRRASPVDILRLLDYPNDYGPVFTRREPSANGVLASRRVDVVDKTALNARLARSYLVELLDRARIA
jgi:hypothetical protein